VTEDVSAEPIPVGAHSHLLRVLEVIEETHDARSVVFEIPAEQAERFSYEPGQFLTLRIPSDGPGPSRGATRWPARRTPMGSSR